MGASSSGSMGSGGQERAFLEDPSHWSIGLDLDTDRAPAPPATRRALRACSSTHPPATSPSPQSPSSPPASSSQSLARRPVPPSISTHEKGLGSGREHEEHPLYRAEEGEEKPESPTIQPTGGLRHQTSAGVLSHQASGILHHQTSGMMHHQTSGMLHPGASGILHHQTSSIYASERSKASTSWQNPKAALSSAMRFFGLTSGINSASALDLAAEVFELALTICMATAPEIMSFVEAFSGEEKKALQRLCSTAKKVGLLGASSPKWNTPAPLSELARAFLTQENSASRGRSGSKDINPMTMNELRSASSLSLSSAVAAKGGKDMKDVKRQVTFDMEEQDKSSSGSGKTSLKRGGTGSRSNLGLDRSRSDLGRVLNLNRSASDLSCSSFTDFNKRNKGFNIASPEKMRPSFLDFLTSLEQRPHGTGHAGMGMGMGMPGTGMPMGAVSMMMKGMAQMQDGASMTGAVKTVDVSKGYGFIMSQGLPTDIYFKLEEPVMQGQQVGFTLKWTKDGKPQARDVKPALVGGEILVGTVKSFSDKNDYGFISLSDSPQEVYFKRKTLPEETQAATSNEIVGMTVRCTIKVQKDGKPCAQDMVLVSGPVQGMKRTAGSVEDGSPIMPTKRQRTGFEVPAVMPTVDKNQQFAMASVAAGTQVQGIIKSYNASKGFGFINSSVVPGDIYFKGQMLPAHMQGQQTTNLSGVQVAFTLNFTPDGKAQAADLQTFTTVATAPESYYEVDAFA
mmetsp:Transcript_54725/g.139005  ORF Transcript_54725/g.139005 Transcript_54725/m.139005 type:complete len:738 (+) Transcript_54725:115-2328(+)